MLHSRANRVEHKAGNAPGDLLPEQRSGAKRQCRERDEAAESLDRPLFHFVLTVKKCQASFGTAS
jgi:hypothetical protein